MKEMAQNKFLLATRYYMKGTAGIESIREAYPLREHLESKSFEFSRTRASILSKRSQERKRIDELLEQNKGEDRRLRTEATKEIITEVKQSLKQAIDNLDLQKGDTDTYGDSAKISDFLDAAIHISLNFVELCLYEKMIIGNLGRLGLCTIEDLKSGNWNEVLKLKNDEQMIFQYLKKIPALA